MPLGVDERLHIIGVEVEFDGPRERLCRSRDADPQLFGLKQYAFGSFLASNNVGVFTKLGKVFRISGISDFDHGGYA